MRLGWNRGGAPPDVTLGLTFGYVVCLSVLTALKGGKGTVFFIRVSRKAEDMHPGQ
jgi:hypothetical protein